MAATRYTARFQLPDLLEQGRDQVVTCEVYRDDQLVLPTDGTVTVYDAAGQQVSSPAVTFPGSIATATAPSADTDGESLGIGWRIEWLLTMPGGAVHRFVNDAALVRKRLYPVIAGVDIARRLRALDPSLPAVVTTRTSFQSDIDEADTEVQLRLLEDARRPWLVANPSALRQTWLYTTIAIVLEGLAVQNAEQWGPVAETWRKKANDAYDAAKAKFDFNEDGLVEEPEESEGVRQGTVWLC